MGDLFDWVTLPGLLAGAVDILASNLGLILVAVCIGPVIAYKGFELLRDAVQERQDYRGQMGLTEWQRYHSLKHGYEASLGKMSLSGADKRLIQQGNRRASYLAGQHRKAQSTFRSMGMRPPQRRSGGFSSRRGSRGYGRRGRYGGY